MIVPLLLTAAGGHIEQVADCQRLARGVEKSLHDKRAGNRIVVVHAHVLPAGMR